MRFCDRLRPIVGDRAFTLTREGIKLRDGEMWKPNPDVRIYRQVAGKRVLRDRGSVAANKAQNGWNELDTFVRVA